MTNQSESGPGNRDNEKLTLYSLEPALAAV